ncbi:hypothetical protein OE88DRAFT_280058 [Heliocybe sulcata]|uniref:Uncharacterized protein n=1 Tax=Heliocybe sulcata TaxID=5364 RepID=A0A5C3N012_9AGAM|nr:hypothetical protein OE88DRAFT_280058 [Heliocybe sulcata]
MPTVYKSHMSSQTSAPSLTSSDSFGSRSSRPSWTQTPTDETEPEPVLDIFLTCDGTSPSRLRRRIPKDTYRTAVAGARRLKGALVQKVAGLRPHGSSKENNVVSIETGDITSDSVTTIPDELSKTGEDIATEASSVKTEPQYPSYIATTESADDLPEEKPLYLADLDDEPIGWECPCQSLPHTPFEEDPQNMQSASPPSSHSLEDRPFGVRQAVNLPLKVVFFLPWCVLVGAAIMVCPALVPIIAFRTGYFRNRQSSRLHRLAYYVDSAAHHVLIFVAFLGFTGWYLPGLRTLFVLVLALATLHAWGSFLLGRRKSCEQDERVDLWASLRNSRRVDGDVIISGLNFQSVVKTKQEHK